MSGPRKNHLSIDGAQVKEEEHVSSYKPIPESDQELRTSKSSLSKKEKATSDEAEEKLLNKEDEVKIVAMTDSTAKYDHRNGDTKIEVDTNKRQFSGLSKEELLKYADDPFWVRLRWLMFALFWALWLGMLAGAIAIIVRAPKCAAPIAKTWFEIGPLVDRTSEAAVDYAELEAELPLLESSRVQGVFINPCTDTYEVLDSTSCVDKFKAFLEKAKKRSIKLIVDLTANFVSTDHAWFAASENRTADYSEYFVWGASKDSDGTRPKPPNNWVSRYNEGAWTWSERRREYYLHQYRIQQADLNFRHAAVVRQFDTVLKKWLEAGAAGVRLHHARQLLVNPALPEEPLAREKAALDATLHNYAFLRHKETSDQAGLDELLAHWGHLVSASNAENVFTISEDGVLNPEWYRLRNASILRPPSAAPRTLSDVAQAARDLDRLLDNWTALQLTSPSAEGNVEIAALAMLLPAAPVLQTSQLPEHNNDTAASESFAHLVSLREDASIKFGGWRVEAVPADSGALMLACARWKAGHTGYVAVHNPGDSARANLTALASLPADLTVHHVSHSVRQATNYTSNKLVATGDILVPAHSTVVLSYVPKMAAEQ